MEIHIKTKINKARLARLATVDRGCKPHVIPVVFVLDNDHNCYFIPIDDKTKQGRPENLKRVKNIQENPNVALLIDEYNEDWTKLYFIMIRGKGSILGGKKLEQNEMSLLKKAHGLLYDKYNQYQTTGIGKYVIMVIPQKVTTWNDESL